MADDTAPPPARDSTGRAAGEERYSDAVDASSEALARLGTLDNGKTLFESAVDRRPGASTLCYVGGMAEKVHGETIPVKGAYLNYTRREPEASWAPSRPGTSRSRMEGGSGDRLRQRGGAHAVGAHDLRVGVVDLS